MKWFFITLVSLIALMLIGKTVAKMSSGTSEQPAISIRDDFFLVKADDSEFTLREMTKSGMVVMHVDLDGESFCPCDYVESLNTLPEIYPEIQFATVLTRESHQKLPSKDGQPIAFPWDIYFDGERGMRSLYRLNQDTTFLLINSDGHLVAAIPASLYSKNQMKLLHKLITWL